MSNDINQFLRRRLQQITADIKEIAAIPAGPFKEKKKIEFLKAKLAKYPFLKEIKIDAENNLSARIKGKTCKNILICAHADVALDLAENKIYQKGDLLYGHGVCDNTAGIMAIFSLLDFIKERELVPDYNIIVLFTVGEEGLGAKRGMRFFMKNNRKIDLVINAESHDVGRITTGAIGQFRTRIDVSCREGGHSWRDYGNPNAIALLAELICRLGKIPNLKKGRVTCNFGIASGGESINSIAKEAQVLYEFRAAETADYAKAKAAFKKIIATFVSHGGVKPDIKIITDSPPASLNKSHEIFKYTEKIHRELGIKSFYKDGNSDGDIPLQYGIPTVTIGNGNGKQTHSTQESLMISSLPYGYAQLMAMILQISALKFLKPTQNT